MPVKDYFRPQADKKYRVAAVGGTLVLGAAALVLVFSIIGALFNLPFIGQGLGNFFVQSYGALAFLIPAYLVWAAVILAAPSYRPDRIFVLAAAIIPFMTLAIGIGFIQDFNYQADRFPVLQKAGKAGFSFFMVLLAFVEGMIIRAFIPLIFPELAAVAAAKAKKTRDAKDYSGKNFSPGAAEAPAREREGKIIKYLPGPRSVENSGSATGDKGSSAAPGPEPEKSGVPAAVSFPSPRPLASARALEELEQAVSWSSGSPAGGTVYSGRIPLPESADRGGNAGQPAGGESPDRADTSIEISAEVSGEYFPDEAEFEKLPQDEAELVAAVAAILPKNAAIPFESVPPRKPASADAKAIRAGELAGELAGEAEAEFDSPVPLRTAPGAVAPASLMAKKKFRDGRYQIPVEGILNQYPDGQYWIIDQGTEFAAVILRETLEEFNIQAEVTGIKKGPVITMFEILPAPGVKLSKITNLQDNIALRLAASSVRIVAPIPGKHAVGIEVPNKKRNIVSFREIIEGELRRDSRAKKQEIPVVLGKDITGEAQTVDLAQTPHLLIAGSTGSGKSVCVNSLILSILYQRSPVDCRLILIDPKIVELKLYNDIPHLLTPVITEPKRAFQALQYCLFEMERRYACLDSMGVRDVKSYNRRIKERNIAAEHMPYIVIVIDEFADLMVTTGKEMESTVARLAAMSRAVGIHLVLATQRPSIDVITGLIKANIPSRIAFMVASKMDSRIIIDQIGAEKLLGKGDMLYAGVVDPFPIRMQGAFISEEEVERVVEYVKNLGEPDYIDDEIFYDEDDDENDPSLFSDGEDPLYDKALEIVMQQGKASASYIQRRLKIGYNRAARIVEDMAARGLVGPAQGSKPRELLHAM
ncbi:MAG: DNA translocase FtsK [Spirochaetaceae bacterium]|nr:DNA translocase FtsK [Spirochaetaceae bacterium]